MSTWKRAGALACFTGAALLAPAAWGQTMYRCSEGGAARWSDRPCPANGHTKISAYGPARENTSPRQGYTPPVQKAPDHLQYLSPACAQINDAMRTASARGVGHATQAELREEYQRKCSDDESDARRRVSQERRDQREQHRAQQKAEQQEKAHQTTSREQCHEMLRILAERRKRLDAMTEGERGDFKRFEENYKGRCSAG
jgi:hypothetical protein